MQINRRITNGLAWAGLLLVVAVPVADAVSGQLMGDEAQIAVASVGSDAEIVAPIPAPLSQRPHVAVAKPVAEVAAVTPAKAAGAKPAVPVTSVDSFLASGKKLPSYITGGDDAPAQAAVATPAVAPVAAKPILIAPIQTAMVPVKPAAPAVAATPITPAPAGIATAPTAPALIDPVEVSTLTPAKIAPLPMPLSMRPKPVTQPLVAQTVNEEIVLPPEIVAGNDPRPVVVDDLQDWESGPLSDFLAQRERQQQSSATVTSDDDVYYRERPNRRPPRDIYLGPVQDDEVFYPFAN